MKGGAEIRRWVMAAGALAAVATRVAARPCHASGFLIYDLSGDAIGRASAVTAAVSEPAAIWFNPAALPFMKGVNASVGGVFVTASSRFSPARGGADTNSERGHFVPPTVLARAALHDRVAVRIWVYS